MQNIISYFYSFENGKKHDLDVLLLVFRTHLNNKGAMSSVVMWFNCFIF